MGCNCKNKKKAEEPSSFKKAAEVIKKLWNSAEHISEVDEIIEIEEEEDNTNGKD